MKPNCFKETNKCKLFGYILTLVKKMLKFLRQKTLKVRYNFLSLCCTDFLKVAIKQKPYL